MTANAHVLVVEDEPNVARMLVESRSYRDPMSLDAVGAEFVRRVGVVVRPGPGRGLVADVLVKTARVALYGPRETGVVTRF